MRISTSQFYKSGLNTINAQQARQLDIFTQIGTGKKIVSPKDDPLGAARALNLSNNMAINDRFAENRSIANQNLAFEESILNEVATTLVAIKTRIVEAGNGTMADADRATLSEVVNSLRNQVLGLANSTDGNGQYIFSGNQSDRAAFAPDVTGNINWQGDLGNRAIQVSSSRQLSSADTGYTVFTRAVSGENSYLTSAANTNTGTGQISAPNISDPNGANVGNNFSIVFSGTPLSYTVETRNADGVVVGTDGPNAYEADKERLALPGGVDVAFSGTPAEGDTFSVNHARNEDINIFNTLDDLAAALNTSTSTDPQAAARLRNAMSSATQRIDANYNTVLTTRASIGTRMNEIEALDASGEQRRLDFRSEISAIEDVDYYEASTELTMRGMALEAASLAFKKIQGLSLFRTLG
ncbi:flagellar hook-associated protein FlgL [Advenella sp. WQ 585]|uniref:Flagellar hook-associated protein FlgL n=1 Tax=Advenella mandrilli TaxID=2800330 RepID=A0ABS1EEH9_9BURK|nr:flagellar hook-associated protein FlgL [Advenella mandrilli]MBK1781550.1 flagellar hook-associated protein FlgL [Advenella mandrilli]